MRNVGTLLGIAAGLVVLAMLHPGVRWLLLWASGSFAVVAAAYAGQKPQVFGKRVDGAMAWGPCFLLLPYLLPTWLLWQCQTRFSREPACHEIVPGLWLGRRASASAIPADVTLIVDLTSEFVEPPDLRINRAYLCLPSLDNAAPEPRAFQEAVGKIAGWKGGVYVHCALGHGRSALVVAAVLMARGIVNDPAEAIVLIQRKRPGVKLNQSQLAFLEREKPPS